jgi:hypothetical protein
MVKEDRKKKDKKDSSEVSAPTEQTVKTKHIQPGKAESFLDHTLRLLEANDKPSDVRKKKKE